jgi:hypothetical protein
MLFLVFSTSRPALVAVVSPTASYDCFLCPLRPGACQMLPQQQQLYRGFVCYVRSSSDSYDLLTRRGIRYTLSSCNILSNSIHTTRKLWRNATAMALLRCAVSSIIFHAAWVVSGFVSSFFFYWNHRQTLSLQLSCFTMGKGCYALRWG